MQIPSSSVEEEFNFDDDMRLQFQGNKYTTGIKDEVVYSDTFYPAKCTRT